MKASTTLAITFVAMIAFAAPAHAGTGYQLYWSWVEPGSSRFYDGTVVGNVFNGSGIRCVVDMQPQRPGYMSSAATAQCTAAGWSGKTTGVVDHHEHGWIFRGAGGQGVRNGDNALVYWVTLQPGRTILR